MKLTIKSIKLSTNRKRQQGTTPLAWRKFIVILIVAALHYLPGILDYWPPELIYSEAVVQSRIIQIGTSWNTLV